MRKFQEKYLFYKDPDESSDDGGDDWGDDPDGGGYDNETAADQGNEYPDTPSGSEVAD